MPDDAAPGAVPDDAAPGAVPDDAAPGAEPAGSWPQHDREGSWLVDERGGRMLAWHVAGGVFNLGFSDQRMARAVADIVLDHDTGLWSDPSERRLAGERAFVELFPDPLDHAYFTPSASEAFEVACKLAKLATRRPGLVSVTGGYYGAVGFALAMDNPVLQPEVFTPMAGMIPKAAFGSVEAMDALVDGTTAAVCIETIQVPAGVYEQPDGYLAEVRRICDERGAVLIVDEVQGGLLRSGELWAFERHGMVPDIVVTGKGLSGGYYPLGALTYTGALHDHVDSFPPVHRSSFSGGEIGARIAGETARRYLDPALRSHVDVVGARLGAGLARISADHPGAIAAIRGRGLVYGVELATAFAHQMAEACEARGLYLHATLEPRTVQVMPALVTTADEIDWGLERFEEALVSLGSNGD